MQPCKIVSSYEQNTRATLHLILKCILCCEHFLQEAKHDKPYNRDGGRTTVLSLIFIVALLLHIERAAGRTSAEFVFI
jgi:hypothetical protein